jgi:hypothetical protein
MAVWRSRTSRGHSDKGRTATRGVASYALRVEPLSPELALVDQDLAERARAELVDAGEAAPPAAPAMESEQTQSPLRPSPKPQQTHSRAPVEATPRWGSTWRRAIVAVAVLAAALGGAAAIWARYDDGAPSSGGLAQPATQPQREDSPSTAHVRPATRQGRKATGLGPRRVVPRHALRPPRPAAFHVPGAPKEPLDEITLPARARRLDAWLTSGRGPNAANLRHWLYQHAWIVTGARFGWWHGAEALSVLIRVDRRIESKWGIGFRSEAIARRALAAVEARAK